MNILRHATAYTLGACFAAVASAQEPLSKEITVEKEIIPQEREASRLFQQPQLVLPAIQQKRLNWTDRAISAPVTPGITILPPSQYASTVERQLYRGYVDVGYFPSFQLGASAGYRFVDDEFTRAGAWLQYDGSQYSKKNIYSIKPTFKDHSLTIGADISHQFEGIGTLSANIGYGMNSLWFPVSEYTYLDGTMTDNGFSQTANRFGLGVNWDTNLGALDITAGINYGFFGFSKPYTGIDIKALKNNSFSVSLGGKYALGQKSAIGADISYSSTAFTEHMDIILDSDYLFKGFKVPSTSYGVVEFHPYFLSQGEHYSARLGVELTAQTGDVSGVNIGPDVRLDWMPSQQFSLYAQVQSAYIKLNTLGAMMDRNHYINPSIAYMPTRMKGQLDFGLVIGPFAGASFEVWGGIGKYDFANMPVIYSNSFTGNNPAVYPMAWGMYLPMKFNSIHYGLAFNYNYRDVARLRVSYEGAPQKHDEGYIEWQDRAKSVIEASLTVTPIKPLDLTLSYRIRADRATCLMQAEGDEIFKGYLYSFVDLGNVNSLNFSASYRFNDRFTIWANAENLLGEKWQLTYGIPNVGLTGLVGIGYKF